MTSRPPRLHRRQFVLGPEPLLPYGDWHSHELGPGLHLSWDPDLAIAIVAERALIGIAASTDPDRPTPVEQLAGTPDPDSWTGRFVLVDGGRVVPDAGATLGVLLREIGGTVWVSSSVELLRTLAPELPLPPAPLQYGVGMEWYAPPGTGVPGVRRLLPSQELLMPSGRLEARPAFPAVQERPREQVMAALERRLVTGVKGLSAYGRPAIAITSGHDTRVSLAATAKAGVDALAYTFEWPGITLSDRDIAPRLAAAAGIEHRFVPRGPVDRDRLRLWDRHTALHSADADREYFACGQLDALEGCAVDVGGSLFGVAAGHYTHTAFPDPALPATAERTAELVLGEFPARFPDDVRAWSEWLHETLAPWVDWRLQFHLEQRIGGWLGSIAQGVDLAPVPAMHLANSRAYLADSLALPFSYRRKKNHQDDLVRSMAPPLAELPYNVADPRGRRIRTRARREWQELRARRSPVDYVQHRYKRWQRKRG